MNAVTLRMVEKLMEEEYKADCIFFEEEGAFTYDFTIQESDELETSAVLNIYEDRMTLKIEFYFGTNELNNEQKYTLHTYKELTKILQDTLV
jgi:hypothetical protein